MSTRVTCSCGWAKTYPTAGQADFNARRHVCPTSRGARRADRHHRCARCGLEQTYENATATEARTWFRKHSCRKHEEALLRSTLAADRMALIDRTPKPCLHKVANHQHGTNAAYVLDKCRCEPCCKARHAQDDWRRRQQAYGRYNKYVPADPVRAHVRSLMDAGMGLKRIVVVTGVAQGCLWKLMYGKRQADGTQRPSRRVLRETAEKLYAIDPDWTGDLPLADGALLDHATSATASRKLQALVALGWSMSELGRRLDISHVRNAIPVIKGERRLTVATGKKATALFDELCMTLPPEGTRLERQVASRSRKFARTHRWVPPLALDDLALTEEVLGDLDEAAIYRRMQGDKTVRLTKAEKAELVHRWTASGRSLNEMERVTGINTHRKYEEPRRSA